MYFTLQSSDETLIINKKMHNILRSTRVKGESNYYWLNITF
jgi:hypothetical protein